MCISIEGNKCILVMDTYLGLGRCVRGEWDDLHCWRTQLAEIHQPGPTYPRRNSFYGNADSLLELGLQIPPGRRRKKIRAASPQAQGECCRTAGTKIGPEQLDNETEQIGLLYLNTLV